MHQHISSRDWRGLDSLYLKFNHAPNFVESEPENLVFLSQITTLYRRPVLFFEFEKQNCARRRNLNFVIFLRR